MLGDARDKEGGVTGRMCIVHQKGSWMIEELEMRAIGLRKDRERNDFVIFVAMYESKIKNRA